MIDRVLDLDLDFFARPPHTGTTEWDRAPQDIYKTLLGGEDVRKFLEERCGLSLQNKIPGCVVTEHCEAFGIWKQWRQAGILGSLFEVVHVDAHADLGAGFPNPTYKYLNTELLTLPIGDRSNPRFADDAINSGNYLIAAIACGWLSNLSYVHPTRVITDDDLNTNRTLQLQLMVSPESREWIETPHDIPPWIFKDVMGTDFGAVIQLGIKLSDNDGSPIHDSLEPELPFTVIDESKFSSSGFTHIILSQSPKYSPVLLDDLMTVIKEYFSLV